MIPRNGLQLWLDQSQEPVLANGQEVQIWRDLSGNRRTLVGTSPYPIYQANFVNNQPSVYFNSSINPLKNTANFEVLCGFVVARYDSPSFNNYDGLITDLTTNGILVGNVDDTRFFNFGHDLFEFRSNDIIYPQSNQIAPMVNWKVMFFRFWRGIQLDGIQIGQDRMFTDRRWLGSIAEVLLYDRQFCETEIRSISQELAFKYGLGLADVFPYQADYQSDIGTGRKILSSTAESGEVTARIKDRAKKSFGLNFVSRRQAEYETTDAYWQNHYPLDNFIYRDYDLIPPRDFNVRFRLNEQVTRKVRAVNSIDYSLAMDEV